MTVDRRIEDPGDQFPIGMRVLAVDDDPTCLKLLETLLRRCQYHVTRTCQAKTALNMLREKKNKFDLVISDVHMPDMDGFKLLELVGLEMDLPVIMLSANSDPRLVMKGISHGACDYLVKPVRTEELKNVWQHVIRRKKFDANRKKSSSGNQDAANGGGEGDPGSAGTGNLDQFAKGTKKRKDQNEDDDDENGDDDDEDPSSQKKPRVVWSVELHRKFVAAVNHLGIDKAVPKKILDSMNVEKLTRENVASHLQKYRLYLKRISCVANQQANMVAAFGSTDSSYLRMSSMNAHGSFNPLAMSVPFQNQPFRSFQPGGMIGRLNSPAYLGLRLPSSGGMVQLSHVHNPTDSNDQIKFHEQNMLHGVSIPFELDQHHHHHNKGASHVGELSAAIDESDVFPLSAGFADSKIPPPPPNGFSIASNVLMMGHCQDPQGGRDFANQSLKSDFCSTSYSWSSPVSSSGFQSSSCPLTDRFKQAALPSNLRESRIGVNHFDGSSMSSVPVQSHTTIADTQCQASGIGNDSFIQPWDHNKHDSTYHPNPNILSGTVNPLMPVNGGALDNSLDFNSMGQPNYGDPSMVRYGEVEKSTMEAKLKQDYVMPYQQRPQGSYIINNFGSLGDVVSGTMK